MITTLGIRKTIKKMIGIIDYEMGNLMSLSNALKKINVDFFLLKMQIIKIILLI